MKVKYVIVCLIILGVILVISCEIHIYFPDIAQGIQTATPVATIILALLTFTYVIVAVQMVKEMKETRESELRPYVIIDFKFDQHLIDVIVENVGKIAAKDVHFKFVPPLKTAKGEDFNNKGFMLRGFPFIPPSKVFTCFFDTTFDYFKIGKKLPCYEVYISYKNSLSKKQYEEKFILDMFPYKNRVYIERKNLHDIGKYLEDISKDFKRVVKSNAIYIKTSEDIKKEHERFLQLVEQKNKEETIKKKEDDKG